MPVLLLEVYPSIHLLKPFKNIEIMQNSSAVSIVFKIVKEFLIEQQLLLLVMDL